MSFEILGIGRSVPIHYIEQADAASLAQVFCGDDGKHARAISAIYRRTGVRIRHSVILDASTNGAPARQDFYPPATSQQDRGPNTATRMARYEENAGPMAHSAVLAALDQANIEPTQITHLVTVSCTGFSAPGLDVGLVRDVGLQPDVQRTHVGFMGCHGALNGLRISRTITDADPKACVLLCAAELCSLHQQYGTQADRVVSNALFADGAAALVGRQQTDRIGSTPWRVAASGSTIIPNTESQMSWRIGNNGFEMSLSPQVPDTIRQYLRLWIDGWLQKNQLAVSDVGSWAIHPGGPKILQACQDALELDDTMMQPSRSILSDFGNMSSPTVLFILDRLREQQADLPCVVLGFGPGLTIEAALIR